MAITCGVGLQPDRLCFTYPLSFCSETAACRLNSPAGSRSTLSDSLFLLTQQEDARFGRRKGPTPPVSQVSAVRGRPGASHQRGRLRLPAPLLHTSPHQPATVETRSCLTLPLAFRHRARAPRKRTSQAGSHRRSSPNTSRHRDRQSPPVRARAAPPPRRPLANSSSSRRRPRRRSSSPPRRSSPSSSRPRSCRRGLPPLSLLPTGRPEKNPSCAQP